MDGCSFQQYFSHGTKWKGDYKNKSVPEANTGHCVHKEALIAKQFIASTANNPTTLTVILSCHSDCILVKFRYFL